ncbi:unnamed protein product, partial [Nesidiocoris tenuis]
EPYNPGVVNLRATEKSQPIQTASRQNILTYTNCSPQNIKDHLQIVFSPQRSFYAEATSTNLNDRISQPGKSSFSFVLLNKYNT